MLNPCLCSNASLSPSVWADLPIDLVIYILQLTAWNFPQTRSVLYVVSQLAKDAIAPVIYYNTVVKGSASLLQGR